MFKLAKRLQKSIALLDVSFLEENKNITVSIGYTKVSQNEQFKSALKRADEHLYSAKNGGRNCYVTDKEFIPSIVG
ncbi:GGDEF domain-containing protein [Psychrosphaera algicola]|uniref:diguanylate cyclase n=1 Tax=Psychrosphaera algicola TaxID=3023714 RepID=A0ABT5FAY7_9GAMM|nr:diguanylate cyclase [Psychrosphaera sp. G1-22]MDC2888566.1 diguanylate cyclase [Psychrosphaera sp. G1-22]